MDFSLTDLHPGDRIRVIRGFTDFDGIAWSEGQVLEYIDYSYFPYEGGYTFRFTEGDAAARASGPGQRSRNPQTGRVLCPSCVARAACTRD